MNYQKELKNNRELEISGWFGFGLISLPFAFTYWNTTCGLSFGIHFLIFNVEITFWDFDGANTFDNVKDLIKDL